MKNPLGVAIVEDEALARKKMRLLLENDCELKVVGEADSIIDALKLIKEKGPDFILLDIQLGRDSGFDLFRKLDFDPPLPVIFVTAFENYAVKAFEYHAVDYILKPYTSDRFEKAISKIKERFREGNLASYNHRVELLLKKMKENIDNNGTHSTKLIINVSNRTVFVDKEEIDFIQASGNYVEVHVGENKYLIRYTISSFLNDLNHPHFKRIHRSIIINKSSIVELIHSDYGEVDLKLRTGPLLRISRSYKKEFFEEIGL